MPAQDAICLYDLLENAGIPVWTDGGWAVDALLGRQTREHGVLDIALEARFLDQLRAVLGQLAGLEVDVHAFVFEENGDGVYGPPENGDYYRKNALTEQGVVGGQPVRYTGYAPRDKDFHDVMALCQRLGIVPPEEYRKDQDTWEADSPKVSLSSRGTKVFG